ncbi:hypothetical protein, partial [Haemophilus parainfluenzae]|uniref:hypothetical protein n=1 Tax=Haemophilus parainfluenzae TaxID=729 RepID=UPI001CEC9CC7
AHANQVRQPVQVRISQLLLHHSPPKRRSLKRISQTRENGLMVVMPFTWLTAGLWEIECSQPPSDGSDMPAPWRYGVQLEVLPQESGEDGDWFADDGGHSQASQADLKTGSDRLSADDFSSEQPSF